MWESNGNMTSEKLEDILSMSVRSEKVAIKDIKLRTFISEGNKRNELAAHVYDITYGSIIPYTDNLVVIDDSIVRGTTLKQSIISILSRLNPKRLLLYHLPKFDILIFTALIWQAWMNSLLLKLQLRC